jgi:RNA polymerase sigma-70 factor (sigma-E family)
VSAGEEFDEFVARHSRALQQTAWLLTSSWPNAEDLVQIALLRIWQRWDRVAAEARLAYARRVIFNTYLTNQRRSWHAEYPVALVPESDVITWIDPLSGIDLYHSLGAALDSLPARQRATVVLRYYLDLSEPQAAELLGCSVGSIKSHTSRALTKLRALPSLRSLHEGVSNG